MNFGCGKNMLINPDPKVVNTRGCGPLMHYWFRRGFWENIFMGLFGIFVGVYMLFVFQRNRKEYTQLRDDADDRKRMIRTHSMSSVNNKDQPKTNKPRYQYTSMKSAPTNGAAGEYDSDNNSSSVLYQPPATFNPNA
jgi:hypothetical protein